MLLRSGDGQDLARSLRKAETYIHDAQGPVESLTFQSLTHTDCSATKWLAYFSSFGHLRQWKLAQCHTKFVNVGPIFSQIANKPLKIANHFEDFAKMAKFRQIWSYLLWYLLSMIMYIAFKVIETSSQSYKRSTIVIYVSGGENILLKFNKKLYKSSQFISFLFKAI